MGPIFLELRWNQNACGGEFSIDIDKEDNVIISVMESSSFTKTFFNEPKSRNYLSWILLDDDVRASFKSITKYQRMNGVDSQKYRRWNFRFDPPPLRGVELHVRGQWSEEDNVLFVFEIKKIRGLQSPPYRSVSMWHPEFEHSIPGQGNVVRPAGGEPGATLTVHDDIDSNANIEPILLETDTVSIEFKNPFYVSKIATKDRKRPAGEHSEESEGGLTSVSTEEGVLDHGLPGGDLDTLEDETDYSEFFESKFSCFKGMINMLIENHGCALISKKVNELRKVGKSKKHLLSTDDTFRTIADVTLGIGKKTVHLLEVDTSDAEQSLSTQLLVVRSEANWKKDLERLKVELVSSSLRWPQKVLDDLCQEGRHKGAHHPQAPANNKGVLASDSIAGWAARVHGWMMRL